MLSPLWTGSHVDWKVLGYVYDKHETKVQGTCFPFSKLNPKIVSRVGNVLLENLK